MQRPAAGWPAGCSGQPICIQQENGPGVAARTLALSCAELRCVPGSNCGREGRQEKGVCSSLLFRIHGKSNQIENLA